MGRLNYGPLGKTRTKRLLDALLAYANDEFEEGTNLDIQFQWQAQNQLVVKTKVRVLEELTTLDQYPDKLTKEQIKEALQLLRKFLEILDDNRTASQGSEDWHFTLKLWYKRYETQANLKRFDVEWERRRLEQSKPVAGEKSFCIELNSKLIGLWRKRQQGIKDKGFSGSEMGLGELIDLYGGNPLALKIITTMIQEVFDGNVADFLKQNTLVLGDRLRILLNHIHSPLPSS